MSLSNKATATALSILLSLCSSQGIAESYGQWQGFITQGLVGSTDNDFFKQGGDSSAEMFELGINGSWQYNAKLRFSGQTIYQNMGDYQQEELRLDYAIADYQLYSSDELETGIRLGRIKNVQNLYGGALDMPFSRPSIFMPQSIYPALQRGPYVALDGASFYSKHFTERGEINFTINFGEDDFSDQSTRSLLGETARGDITADNMIYGGVQYLYDSSWLLSISVLDMDVEFDADQSSAIGFGDGNIKSYTASAQYQSEFWELSAEYQQAKYDIIGLVPVPLKDIIKAEQAGMQQDGMGYYGQLRYFSTESTTLLLRYDEFYPNKDDKSGRELAETSTLVSCLLGDCSQGAPAHKAYAKTWTGGLSWKPDPQWQLMLDYHYIEGTAWTPPMFSISSSNHKKYWQLWAAQLSFRF